MKNLLFMILTSIFVFFISIEIPKNTIQAKSKGNVMKIKITINNTVHFATMYDNPTARDFLSLLPLTLKLEDYAGTEKISNLPRKLSLKDAPSGIDPSVGDITYYSPWGNMAIFYKDYGYAKGLILLGKMDSGMDLLQNCKEPCNIKIEKIQ